MGRLNLTTEELELLQDSSKLVQIPDGKTKLIDEENRQVLIIDIVKLFNISVFTKIDYYEFVKQMESIGWKYYMSLQNYIYFQRKKTFFKRLYAKFADKS